MEEKEVYIVIESGYEETTILGVFTNEDKAKQITEINHARYGYKKYELDKLTDEGIFEITNYIKDLKEDLGIE